MIKSEEFLSTLLPHAKLSQRGTSKELPSSPNAPASNDFSRNEAAVHTHGFNLAVPSNLDPASINKHNNYDNSLRDSQSWPNVAEGQRLRALKKSTDESFAQKVQNRYPRKRTSGLIKTVQMLPLDESTFAFQKEDPDHIKNIQTQVVAETLLTEKSLKKDKNHHKIKKTKGFPPQDTHVCIIDGSKRKEWLQLEPMKQPDPYKCPASLEEDFPDLKSALKVLSKCTVRHEFDNAAENGAESCSLTQVCQGMNSKGRKFRKKQPRKRDPISVNIIDIIKEPSSCISISSKNLQKIKHKDHERKILGGNILDSSNPVRKKGKHKEEGSRKKVSKIKQIIFSERSKKQEQRDREVSLVPDGALVNPSVNPLCDGIVSLKIDNASTSCTQLVKDDVNYYKEIDIEPTPEYQFSLKDCTNTSIELGNIVRPATSNDGSLPILTNTVTEVLQLNNVPSKLHSRKFRDYCDNIRTKALDEAVTNLLKTIYGFQDRHYQKDPIRAHAKRRFVLGFREVKKFLMLKKLKSIVIAPDLEPVKSPGGLDETVIQIREEGRTQQIPVIFAVGRRQLGFALRRKVPISIVGIISPEGAEELYREVLDQWRIEVNTYQLKVWENM